LKKLSILVLFLLFAVCGKIFAQGADSEYSSKGLDAKDQGRFDEAIEYQTKAIEINPSSTNYNNRGSAYAAKGDYAQALADFTKAIELSPGNSTAYANRAIAHYYLKEYDLAWRDSQASEKAGRSYDHEFIVALRDAPGGSYQNDPEFLKALETPTPAIMDKKLKEIVDNALSQDDAEQY